MFRTRMLLFAMFVVTTLLVGAPFAGARPSARTAATVNVTAKDTFRFVLSRKSAPHGTVVFKVVNRGRIAHDFKIAGKKTKLLKHNQTATLTVTLKKGKHPYICTVLGHAKLGMRGVFTST